MTATISPASAGRLSEAARAAPTSTVSEVTNLLRVVSRHRDRAAFVEHVLKTLADVTDAAEQLNTPTSGHDALLQLLEQPAVLAALRQHDPLASARLRGFHFQARLLEAEGGTCSAEELAKLIGISRQAVDKRRRNGTLIGLSFGRRGYAYPIWQAGLAGLDDVLAELRDVGPWAQAAFMLTPNTWLDGDSPLAALERGEVERVRAAASYYGDQVAM